MSFNDKYHFEKGDWVHGHSQEGEMIHGFVELVDAINEIIKVNVVQSDNERAIGKSIWILTKSAEKLLDMTVATEDQVLSLIDLALQTKDEKWFRELTEKLKSINKNPVSKNRKYESNIGENKISKSNIRGRF